MTDDLVETEMLGRRLRFRPLVARTADGLSISVQDWGSQPRSAQPSRDVLLIHGISQSHRCWLKQLASPLRDRYRLVTYDLRGHGSSDKPLSREYYQDSARWAGEVRAVIEAAGLVHPVIVAWSYAGRVVLDYLQLAGGDAIAGLVMVAATSGSDRALFGAGSSLLKRMGDVSQPSVSIDATREFLQRCFAKALPTAEYDLMLAYNLETPPTVREAMGGRAAPYQALLRTLSMPVLAIHGSEDCFNLPAMAHYTAANCPNARALVYDGVGHAPFWEVPERFNSDLAAYLDALGS